MVAILEPTFADVRNTSPNFQRDGCGFFLDVCFQTDSTGEVPLGRYVYIYIYMYTCTVYMLVIMPSERLIVLTVKLCR